MPDSVPDSSSTSSSSSSDAETDSVSCDSAEYKSNAIDAEDHGCVYHAENQARAGFEVANLLQEQVNNTSWPDGPTTLDELFRWPTYNCCCLLNDPEIGEECTKSAMEHLQYDVYVNDSFSGTGSGSYTLHLQHAHLRRALVAKGLQPGNGKVVTHTTCDVDPQCRKVLQSMHEAYRPEHILGSLESRIRSDVLDALKEARLDALAALESAKCYMTDGDQAEEHALLQAHGEALFSKYMSILLGRSDSFLTTAPSYGTPGVKESLTPYGFKLAWDGNKSSKRMRLRVATAGSICVDHSTIGSGNGLMGLSGIPLSIWVAERVLCEEDVIWHECAPRFPLDVVTQHLPGYTAHEFPHPKHPDKFMALSQHQFGWPSHRPRRYSMLVKDSSCEMPNGIAHLAKLFRKPRISVDAFFSAPEELVLAEKKEYAYKKCLPSNSPFASLLPGTKRVWLDIYRKSPKVQKMIRKLRSQGRPGNRSRLAVVANLDQNPHKRPIISPWMPALLRAGCMWLIKPHLPDDPPNDIVDPTERWLLDVEHLHSMGIPQWPISECDDPYPVFAHMPSRTVRKRLAGNAMHSAVIGNNGSLMSTVSFEVQEPVGQRVGKAMEIGVTGGVLNAALDPSPESMRIRVKMEELVDPEEEDEEAKMNAALRSASVVELQMNFFCQGGGNTRKAWRLNAYEYTGNEGLCISLAARDSIGMGCHEVTCRQNPTSDASLQPCNEEDWAQNFYVDGKLLRSASPADRCLAVDYKSKSSSNCKPITLKLCDSSDPGQRWSVQGGRRPQEVAQLRMEDGYVASVPKAASEFASFDMKVQACKEQDVPNVKSWNQIPSPMMADLVRSHELGSNFTQTASMGSGELLVAKVWAEAICPWYFNPPIHTDSRYIKCYNDELCDPSDDKEDCCASKGGTFMCSSSAPYMCKAKKNGENPSDYFCVQENEDCEIYGGRRPCEGPPGLAGSSGEAGDVGEAGEEGPQGVSGLVTDAVLPPSGGKHMLSQPASNAEVLGALVVNLGMAFLVFRNLKAKIKDRLEGKAGSVAPRS